jgi:hypothetical protein
MQPGMPSAKALGGFDANRRGPPGRALLQRDPLAGVGNEEADVAGHSRVGHGFREVPAGMAAAALSSLLGRERKSFNRSD